MSVPMRSARQRIDLLAELAHRTADPDCDEDVLRLCQRATPETPMETRGTGDTFYFKYNDGGGIDVRRVTIGRAREWARIDHELAADRLTAGTVEFVAPVTVPQPDDRR